MEHLQIIFFSLIFIFNYTCSLTPPGLLKGRFPSHTYPPSDQMLFAQQSGHEHAFPPPPPPQSNNYFKNNSEVDIRVSGLN